jgi:lipid-A-disaccharide synthase
VNPENMASYISALLKSDNSALIARFTDLHRNLQLHADEQAAKAIADLIEV